MKHIALTEGARQELLPRLRRIQGQACSVQRMVEGGRDCTQITHQLASIRATTQSACLFLLKHYARACWMNAAGDPLAEESLDDLIEVVLRSAR